MGKSVCSLFFNSGEEDKNAVNELLNASVQCELNGPISEERTPLLVYDSMRFYGLRSIKSFIERWGRQVFTIIA